MLAVLNNEQLKLLEETLRKNFTGIKMVKEDKRRECLFFRYSNAELINMFSSAKRIEGCSDRTIKYYKNELYKAFKNSEINGTQMTTELLRDYLSGYRCKSRCSKAGIDNIRRVLSSFFN